MGPQEVEEIYTGFLEDTGAMRTKKTTRFEQHHCPQHLCDSTVAPPLPHSGLALWLLRREVGRCGRLCNIV